MNSLADVLKKSLIPVSALLLTLVVIVQVRTARGAGSPSLPALASAPAAPSPIAGGVVAEGRLVTYPGAEVVVAPETSGTVIRLLVKEKEAVRRGQVLAELKADDLRAEL